MKRTLKTVISLILCVAMLFSASAIGFSAADEKIYCDGNCEYYPTVIIPGLGQSGVFVVDDNGDFVLDDAGKRISAFPAYIELPKIISRVAFPVILSLLTQSDLGLSDALSDAIFMAFGINTSDLKAQNTGNVKTEKYHKPYSECTKEEQDLINSHIPFHLYETDLPKDHLYYFTYNSFGNHIDLANELYEYIQMVKKQTGHDKVNIVPISQGGTIASAMFEYHPEIKDQLHKVLFIVPALDGSTIIGDVFNGRVNFLNKDFLYNGFLGNLGLLDANTARLIEILFRILPDELLLSGLNAAVDTLVEDVMIRSTSMWALCPSGDYPTAAEKYLSDPEMADIKAQTYKYYQAQLHRFDNIQALLDEGIQVFCVAQYDYPLIDVGETWDSQNADFIIQLDSTSLGAYAANVGETLPEDYVQKNTYCDNPEHNHISPDRVVDASAGLLPDTTFYFDGQRHDLTQHNDVILKLAFHLIAHDDITDVYSSPDFPQFLNGRDVRNLHTYLAAAEEVDLSALTAEQKAELEAAVKQAEDTLDNNVAPADAFGKAEAKLLDILVEIGAMEAPEVKKDMPILEAISLWLFGSFGTDGFSEIFLSIFKTMFEAISSIL
ncbi:MAG: hypothetical protein IKM25_01225 [Clostridia bacterium]|nr:hypothetical protein [Clostridia bacterium]